MYQRAAPPNWQRYADTPLFNTKAVVRQTGVPAPTLRAWERRYGIFSLKRTEHAYRLYSERDIALIQWLKARVDAGMTISQAVAWLRMLGMPTPGHAAASASSIETPETRSIAAPAIDAPLDLTRLSTALVTSFQALDEALAQQLLASAFSVYTVEDVCLRLIAPTLYRVGELWESGALSIAVEHFASNIISVQLSSLFHAGPSVAAGPLVVIGCAPHELHELGSLLLAVFLRRAGIRVVYLGQNVEPASLLRLIKQWRPALVGLSAMTREALPGLVETATAIARLSPPRPLVVFGGQIFVRDPALVHEVPGVYPGDDAGIVVPRVKRLLKHG